MTEIPQQLGSGIALSTPGQPVDSTVRLTYVPSEEALHFFRVLGMAYADIKEQQVNVNLKTGDLGVSPDGDIWWKIQDNRAVIVASASDIYDTMQAIKNNKTEYTLNEYKDPQTGELTLVQTLMHENAPDTYQLWLAKDPEYQQILTDAVYCLHFYKPAINQNGNLLTEDQIREEALRVGITFEVESNGNPMLPHLPGIRL